MATTNPVNQVLVATGDQALLAINNRVENLAVGQIGFFNFHTGLSISSASPVGDMQDIFIAVGLNKLGTGGGATLEDINKSAGQMIQVRNSKSVTIQAHLTALPDIQDVTMPSAAKCETDYQIKVEYRNSKVYALNGYNQFTKTYTYRTACCADQCTDCGTSDCAALMLGLGAAINADLDALSTATFYANVITATVAAEPTAAGTIVIRVGTATVYTDYSVAIVDADTVTTAAAKIVAVINAQAASPYRATSALGVISVYPKTLTYGSTETLVYQTTVAGMTVTPIVAATYTVVSDTAAFVLANPGVCLGIRITSNPLTAGNFTQGVNPLYNKLRGTKMIISLVGQDSAGFTCSGGLVSSVQNLREEQGEGYDLQQLEYVAGGWNGKPGPYRVSPSTGLARSGFEYYAAKGSKYTQISISYDQFSVAGWGEHLNNLETILAIPCASTTTLVALGALLTAIFVGRFPTMVADVATMDCTNVEVHTINDQTADGIDSIG